MIQLQWSNSFKKGYRALPENIKKIVKKQFRILIDNFHHPSLNIKKMKDPRNIWEGRITKNYRFTFQIEDDIYFLRKVGTHDVLRRP